MPSVMDFASLFIVALALAFIGWAMMVLASRIEHDRQECHTERFGEHEPAPPALPSWARLVSSWLMPFASGQDARADSAVGVDAFLAGGEVIGAPASIWNDARYVPATSTAPTDGTLC